MLLLKLLSTLIVSVMGLILEGPHGIRQCQEMCRQLGGCTSVDFNPNLLLCTLNMNSSDRISIPKLSVHWNFKGTRTDCRICKKTETCVGKLNANCVAVGRRPASQDEGLSVPRSYKKLTYGRRHSYIKKHTGIKTWEEACRVCQVEGGTLVKLDSRGKNRVISQTFTNKQEEYELLWIGLQYRHDNNTWYWMDGTGIGHYSNWHLFEPNNINEKSGAEVCGMISFSKFAGGKWHDSSCQNELKFLCEWIGN